MPAVVFVVDGDPAVRDSLSTLLDLNGYQVRTFSTGAAFIRTARRELNQGVEIQCVVCEEELPDTSGIELFKTTRSFDKAPPFALLVSHRNPNTIDAAHQAGIGPVFLKPLVHRHLIEFIARETSSD